MMMLEMRGSVMLCTSTGSHVCWLYAYFVLVPDIPDDEAQYWTGKLEHINTLGIDDEVCLAGFTDELNNFHCLLFSQ